MKLGNFLAVKAVLTAALGVVFALVPVAAMSLYGTTLDPTGAYMARFFGSVLIGVGLLCWLCSNADRQALEGITLSLFIADTIGFLVALTGQVSGLLNPLGWFNVLLLSLLAAGLGYFRFLKPAV